MRIKKEKLYLMIAGDAKEAQILAAEALKKAFLSSFGSPILLLSSGGSAFGILEHLKITDVPKNFTVGMIDERAVIEPKVNNFSQLKTTRFYKRAKQKGAFFINTTFSNEENLLNLECRFEKDLRNWKMSYPDGKIIATMGIGQDSHTAGVMPYPRSPQKFEKLFENKEKWVVGYDAGKKDRYPLRVTVTNVFLRNHVDETIFYVCGDEKKQALANAISKGPIHKVPARILQDMKKVIIFTDISGYNDL